jgi:hypothetical protein
MNILSRLIAPLLAFILATAAWGGVWLLYSSITAAADAHAQEIASAESASAQDAAKARTRAFALDTAAKREELTSIVHVDVIAAAKTIEAIGPAAGVTLKVSGAAEEQANLSRTAAAHPLRAVGFTLNATGSFANVMKAAELIDALPFPAVSEQLDIFQVPADVSSKSVPQWQLSERIRLFTDNDLSS